MRDLIFFDACISVLISAASQTTLNEISDLLIREGSSAIKPGCLLQFLLGILAQRVGRSGQKLVKGGNS